MAPPCGYKTRDKLNTYAQQYDKIKCKINSIFMYNNFRLSSFDI